MSSFRADRCVVERGGTSRWWPGLVGSFLAVWSVTGNTAGASAGSPAAVRFDVPQFVACRDVSPGPSGPEIGPRRLVEFRLPITALPADGQVRSRLQYTYRLVHPTGAVEFVDYQPRTTQDTAVAGTIAVETTRERQESTGLSVSGTFQQLVQGTLHGDRGQKQATHLRYELKPPRDVALVAGTLQRGGGVYFQLRPISDATWEGAHEFAVVLCVPSAWRGDLLYVHCEAAELQAGRPASRGAAQFTVGLYAEGDEAARDTAEQYHQAEKALRRAAARQQQAIEREAVPTVVHRVAAWLDAYQPRIPAGWLDRLLFGPPQSGEPAFVDHLPPDVRQAVARYVRAKRRLQELSVGRGPLAAAHGALAWESG